MKSFSFICFLTLAVVATAQEKNLLKLLHDGNNKFTARMFTEVAKGNPEKSFVMSAYSVLTPLAQIALASVDESHDEILKAIGMPNDNTTKEVFSMANTRIRSVKGITLKTASKIYVAKGYELNSEFAATTKDVFDSEVQNVNFVDSENTAKEVNTWVEQQTNNRIKDLVKPDSLTVDTRALLVNAIYFKGLWEYQFKKQLTYETDFHVNKDKKVKVSMMFRRGDYNYGDDNELNAQILEIPYEGGEASLLIVLPHQGTTVSQLEEKLKDPNVLDRSRENMYEREVEVHIPKFKIETTTDLKETLANMNVKKMFEPHTAKMYNLLKSPEALYISEATQKAFIEVNEEGAEAGAANLFQFTLFSNDDNPPVFNADRPFYYVIKSNSLPLFNGVMYGE